MPNLAIELSETYDSISRPVVLAVVRELIDRLALPTGTSVNYSGAVDTVAQKGSTLSEKDNPVPAEFPFTSKATITVNEQYLEDRILTTAVRKHENVNVFVDRALDVYLKPVYMATQMTVSFRYRAPDRNAALRWQNELRRRASQGQAEQLLDAHYHYPIPKEFLVILTNIFDQREMTAGYGETLKDYFKQHFTDRATAITTLVGTHPELAISEYQVGIVGWYNFTNPETPEAEGNSGVHEVGFDFTFNFDKVTSMVMKYPIVVHNQLLPSHLLPTEPPYELAQQRRHPSWSRWLADSYTPLYDTTKGVTGYVVPEFDDWLPITSNPNTDCLYTTLLCVDLEDPRALLSLRELGDYQLSPAILNFLEAEYPYITTHRQSVFHLSLFRGYEPLEDAAITTLPSLEVRATSDMSPRLQYHFRISLFFDLTVVDKKAVERLRRYPEAAREIINTLDEKEVGYSDDLETVGGGKIITKDSLERVVERIAVTIQRPNIKSNNRSDGAMRGVSEPRMRTIATSSIIVHKVDTQYANHDTQQPATARKAARNPTNYRAAPQRGSGGHKADSSVESTEVRGGISMVNDLLSASPRSRQ